MLLAKPETPNIISEFFQWPHGNRGGKSLLLDKCTADMRF